MNPTYDEQVKNIQGVKSTSDADKAFAISYLKKPDNLILPDKPLPTYGGMEGAIGIPVIETEADRLKKESDNSRDDYLKEMEASGNISSSIDYDEVDRTKKEKDRLDAQLLQEQTTNRRNLETIRTTFGGTTAGLSAEIESANRKSLSAQADIALLKYVADNDYAGASAIADRQVAMKMEQSNAKLAAKKVIYEDNKEIWTAKQKEILEKSIRDDERAYKKEEDLQNSIKDIKLQAIENEAPASVISGLLKAKTFDEAIKAAGKYGGDYLSNRIKKASLAKTNADITKTNAEIDKIRSDIKLDNTVVDTSSLPNTNAGIAAKLMASAKNDKQLDATERQALAKARNVISQLDVLESNISKQNKTGFIKGRVGNFLEKFGLDTDIGVINAQLQAVTPNLARGIYGEVGVLTDNDIKLYRTTLPRIDRKEDQNDAIMALTLKTVAKSIENTLTGAANSNIDVSGWTQDYLTLNKQITDIEDRIGISKTAVDEITKNSPELLPAIKEMYANGLKDGDILEALNAR